MFAVWKFLVQRRRFSLIVIVAIVVLGAGAIVRIPKESAPKVNVPIAVVTTVLPGGSAEDIESLITNTLEDPLKNNLSDVRKIQSVSQESISTIIVEFNARADIVASLRDVRDVVNRYKKDLPKDAREPRVVQIDLGNQPVITATISGAIPSEILYRRANEASDAIKAIPGVASITVSGLPKRQVTILLNRTALAQHQVTITEVTQAIARANVSAPVGNIQIQGVNFPVRLSGDFTNTKNLAALPILSRDGAPIYLRDISRVIDGRAPPRTVSRTSQGGAVSQQSVTFEIFKNSDAQITTVSRAIRNSLTTLTTSGNVLEGLHVTIVYDNGKRLIDDLNTLTRSGFQTVLLVTLVLLIAVGWREAFIAALSIPLSFLIALTGLYYSGGTLNFVSLFALILSIGIIVDSTIVVVEGINSHFADIQKVPDESSAQRFASKQQVILEVLREFHIPLTTGTLTTVAVFVPLFIVSGITGEFIKSIPTTIVFVLSASLVVALGFVPLLAHTILKRGHEIHGWFATHREVVITRVEQWYRDTLQYIVSHRETGSIFLGTLVVLLLISLTLPTLGAVHVVFFEDSNADNIVISARTPVGTTLTQTSFEMRKIEEVLYAIPEIESFATTVGSGSSFTNPFGGTSQGNTLSNIFITLRPDRVRTANTIMDILRARLASATSATIRIEQLSDGPPSLAPVTITLFGNNFETLTTASQVVAMALKRIPGTTGVDASMSDSAHEFVFSVNRDKATSFGVAINTIAISLRSALQGVTATTIKQLGDDIDVVVRVAPRDDMNVSVINANKTNINTLRDLTVPTPQGALPISLFTHVTTQQSRASIQHKDGMRVATVSSRLTTQGNSLQVEQALKVQLKKTPLPKNIRISYGGESKDIDQSFKDMFTALLLGLVAMFAILVLQFNSFRYAGYVLSIVPLSLIGVFLGLMITGSPLSFPSIMGFIALAGIVVNNVIILIDAIHIERKKYEGQKTIQEMVIDASVTRLRPVLLTALTTVIGVIPLLFAAAIWVPLAYSLMFGLTFATIITLVLVPVIYVRWPGKME